MNAFCLIMAMTFSATTTVGGRLYNARVQKYENVSGLYTTLVPCFGALGWLCIWITDLSFDIRVIPYSLLYGLFYLSFTVGMLCALKYGSTSLTGLVKQISLVGVSIWGFAFWATPFSYVAIIGIILTVAALVLCLLKREEGSDNYDVRRWMLYITLVAVGNAGCSITQRYQQIAFNYEYKNGFMFFAILFTALVCLLFAVNGKKNNWDSAIREAWWCPAITGLSGAFSNVFIFLMIRDNMSSSVIYPGIAVGGLMITTLISYSFFKERLRPLQWVGLAVGAAALVLLNL